LVAAGILILAVCPGAPYGPPLTALAGGKTAVSVGLMVILAGSSVLVAPLLLAFFLPLVTGGADLHVDPLGLFGAILATQLIPLCGGLAISHWRPDWAARWLGPAVATSKILNATTLAVILISQFPRLLDVRPDGVIGMLLLLGLSLGAGWSAGGPGDEGRKAVALTTAIRNVGLGLVIASSTYAGSSVVTTVVVYGLLQLLGSLLVALRWHRVSLRARSGTRIERARAPKSAAGRRRT
jgi:bile acid:Na+ symporter, BASS family